MSSSSPLSSSSYFSIILITFAAVLIHLAKEMSSKRTFFISDRRMLEHKCEWDPDHIEKPVRLSAILETLQEDGILDQCTQLESSECSMEDLLLVHSVEHVERIQAMSGIADMDTLERFSAQHEDIYVNGASWQCALLSAGCALKAMETVLKEANSTKADGKSSAGSGRRTAPNAFAAIRPPGHHASRDAPCGFCLFNNVAICARKARAQFGVQRVLILDWDVHAGQGTQYCVKDDPDGTLLISAHRYERGAFWPELPESAVVHGYPNTINAPLNAVDLGDADYAALMHFLVLPLIHQWRPDLILVSCGFDAAIGDPQGDMCVSPAGFGYMTGLLAKLDIPLCLLLEGGYFIPSLAQGALHCVRALLQRAPSVRNFCQMAPSPDFLHMLFANQLVHSAKWPLFAKWIRLLNALRGEQTELPIIEIPQDEYIGHRCVPIPHPTRDTYPPRPPELELAFERQLCILMEQYGKGAAQNKKELLELALKQTTGVDGKMQLVLNSFGKAGGTELVEVFPICGRDHFVLIYFFILLPLAFQCFDICFEDATLLPLDGAEFAKLTERFGEEDNKEENCSADEEELETQMTVLKRFLTLFPQLKPYLLF